MIAGSSDDIDAKKADITLKFEDKIPVRMIPKDGASFDFQGEPASYTPNPFMMVMEKGQLLRAKPAATPAQKRAGAQKAGGAIENVCSTEKAAREGCLFILGPGVGRVVSVLSPRSGLWRKPVSQPRLRRGLHVLRRFAASWNAQRTIFFSMVTGRVLRGGRLTPSRSWRTSILSSVMVRLRVLRCMPSSRAARHWLPLFSCSTVRMKRFLNSRTPSE